MDLTLDVGAAILSCISIVVTGLLGLFTYWNERRRDKEKAENALKAVLVPEFVRYQDVRGREVTMSQALRIKNYGDGIAQNVKYLVDDQEPKGQKSMYLGPKVINFIAPSAHFDITYVGIVGDTGIHNITVTWDDDFKKDNRIVSTISFI